MESEFEPETPLEEDHSQVAEKDRSGKAESEIEEDHYKQDLEVYLQIEEARKRDEQPGVLSTLTEPFWLLLRRVDWTQAASRRMVISAYFFGVVNPAICFVLALLGVHWAADQPWQNGSLGTYTKLMLQWPAVAPFYPVFGFSAACLAYWCFQPLDAGKHFVARFGIYVGVLLSLQSALMVYGIPSSIANACIGALILLVYAAILLGVFWLFLIPAFLLYDSYSAVVRKNIIRGLAIAPILFLVALAYSIPSTGLLSVVLAIAAPVLALGFYSYASLKVFYAERRPIRFSILRLFGITTWVSGFFGAWRASIQLMLVEYAKLPTENPNCFVSSAAANGYAAFVGAEEVVRGGCRLKVNRQMRVLKAGEFAFQCALPSMHLCVRKVYNRMGPILARLIRKRRLPATFCYCAFKPLEWSIRFLLLFAGIDRRLVDRIYR
ncbi:MAG: DUF6688 family protein [Planctomycetota bacterium]